MVTRGIGTQYRKAVVAVLWGWLAVWATAQEAAPLFFSTQENRWLNEHHRTFRVGLTQIPNLVLVSTPQQAGYRGFAVDLFKQMERLAKLRFEYRYFDTWEALMQAAKARRIDIIFLAQKTPSRLSYLEFTDTVLTVHNKIIANRTASFQPTRKTLAQARVAVTKGSALSEYLKARFSDITLVEVPSEQAALRMLMRKGVDAAVAEPVRSGYYINAENLNHLYVSDDLGYDYHLAVAVRNDMPYLSVILSKVLHAVSDDTLKALRLKWGYMQDERQAIEWQSLAVLAAFIIAAVALSGYLYRTNQKLKAANRSYALEVKRRKIAHEKLRTLLKEHEALNKTLEKRVADKVEENKRQQLFMLHQNRLAQMGELLSMIAHQWRQPLHTLAILHHILVRKYRKGILDDTSVEEFERQAGRQIAVMSKTIDDFRNFLDPQKEKQIFDVRDVVRQNVTLVESMFVWYDIRIETLLPQEPCTIYGHQAALAQAMLNILNNAKDALLEREIAAKCIWFHVTRQERRVVVSVEDNAGGIDEAIAGRIFDPYFSTKKEKNGTGLGLYMAKKIVHEQLQGTLECRQGEHGACFVMTFPLFEHAETKEGSDASV